jgi:hypothetical protein
MIFKGQQEILPNRRHNGCSISLLRWAAFLVLSLFQFNFASAATYTSVASGNWSSSSTWSPAAVPTSADVVIISGGTTVTVDVSNAVCSSLTIGDNNKATATLSFNSGTQLTVTGIVTYGGNGNSLRNGAIDMTYGGYLKCSSFSIANFQSWTPGKGSVEFTGAFTVTTDFADFNNLIINSSGTVTLSGSTIITGTLGLTSGTLASGGLLTMNTGSVISRSGGSMTGRIYSSSPYDLSYTGNAKTMGAERTGVGLRNITVALTSGQMLTQDSILTITNLTLTSGNYSLGSNALTMNGNLTVNDTLSGSGTITMQSSGNTIDGTGKITNTGALTFISGDKSFLSTANLSIAGPMTISGAITVTNYGMVTSTSSSGINGTVSGSSWVNSTNATLNVAGPVLSTGILLASSSGNTINYNGITAQTVKSATYYTLGINNGSQTATLGGDITVGANLTITGGTLDASTSNYALTLAGNFTNNGTFTARSASVTLNGSSTQTVSGTGTFSLYNLVINNASGVSLSKNLTVSHQLTLTNGVFDAGTNTVTIGSGASVSGGSSSSYVKGKLTKTVGTGSSVNVMFEIGGSKYMPVKLNFPSVTSSGTITATITSGEHAQISTACVSSQSDVNSYWTLISSGVAPVSYSGSFYYHPTDFDAVASASRFKSILYNNGWTTLTVGSSNDTGLSVTALTAFGDVVIGNFNPRVITQPTNVTSCAGSTINYSITASGSGITYIWQENTGSAWANITNAGIYSGASTGTLTLTGITSGMAGYQYRCIVSSTTNCIWADTSSAASLGFSSSFTINTQPSSAQICSGVGTTFSVSASGSVSGYQWQLSTNSGSSWSNVSNGGAYSGATANTLTISSVSAGMSGYQYRCIVSSNCASPVNSNTATLTLMSAPSISSNPSSATVCQNGNATFSVTASGSNISYQWQLSTNSGSSWSNISNSGMYSGATTGALTITGATTLMNSYQVRCQVSGSCTPPAVSNAATITVNAKTTVTSQPSDVTVFYNTSRNAAFSTSATGTGTITYQWQENTGSGWNNLSNTGIYSGVTTTTLAITGASLNMDSYKYRCVATGTCGSDTSSSAVMYLSFSFTITANTNWSSLSPTPTSTSTIEVRNGAVLTVDVANATCATLQLGRKPNPSSGDGTLSFNSGSQLTVAGPGDNVSLGDQQKLGNIDMTNGGTLICHGIYVETLGTWTPGSGTIQVTGVTTLPSAFTSYNNLTIDGLAVTLSANTTVSGALNVKSGATLNTSAYTLGVGGNITVDGTLSGTGAITSTGSGINISGAGSITNTTTFTLSTGNKTILSGSNLNLYGTLAISGAITVTNNGSVTQNSTGGITGSVSGSTWVNAGGSSLSSVGTILTTGTLTATDTGNTIIYTGTTSSCTIKPTTYTNITINKATQTATIGAATTINGKLTLTNGTLAASTFLTMGSGSMIIRDAGTLTGTLQGSNAYDVQYIGNYKIVSNEINSYLRDLTINLNTGQSLTLAAAIAVGRNLTITKGTLDVSTSNYAVTVKGNLINYGSLNGSGIFTFSGISAQSMTGTSNINFYSLTINNSGNTITVSCPISIAGTLTLTAGTLAAGTNLSMGSGSNMVIQAGNLTGTPQGTNLYDITYSLNSKTTGGGLNSAYVRDVTVNLMSGQTLTLGSALSCNRNLTLTSGTLDISTNNYTITVKGNFVNNAAFTQRSGSVTFSGSSAQTISGSSATTFNQLVLNNSAGLTASSAIQVNDTLKLQAGTLAGSTNLTMGSGSTIQVSGGSLSGTLQGSNAYSVYYTGNSKTPGVEVSNSGLQSLTVGLTSGQTLTLGAALSLAKNLTISSGTFDVSVSNYAVGLKGDFTNNATFNGRSATVTFNGTTAQGIKGTSASSFYNLIINNSAGASLSASATVSNTLTLTSGNLNLGNYKLTLNGGAISGTATNLKTTSGSSLEFGGSTSGITVPTSVQNLSKLVVNNSSNIALSTSLTIADTLTFKAGKLFIDTSSITIGNTGDISGYDTTKYIVTKNNALSGGSLKRTVSTSIVYFPIGSSTTYSPARLKVDVGSSDVFSMRVFDQMLANGTTGTQNTKDVLNKTWLIARQNASSISTTLYLGWLRTAETSGFKESAVGVTHYTNNAWNHSLTYTAYTSLDNVLWSSTTGLTSFSPFSVTDNNISMSHQVNLKVYLQGPYDTNLSAMTTNLGSSIPASQPYNGSPWNYAGTEHVTAIPSASIVDWVLVQIRNANSPATANSSTIDSTKAGFLLNTGQIVGLDGVTPITFTIKPSGNYYVVVYHRNHIPILSTIPISYTNQQFTVDFTTANDAAYGSSAQSDLTGTGVYGMYAGRAENTTPFLIDGYDKSASWSDRNKTNGYYITDCNLDGESDATDRTIIYNNLNQTSQIP